MRRDGCPAEAKLLEKCLRLLFTTNDLSAVKAYALRQFDKTLSGRASLQDFVFAAQVRLGTYKQESTAPPGAQVAVNRRRLDPRDAPDMYERVPYVVVHPPSGPQAKLIESARRPEDLLFGAAAASGGLQINATYYITKRFLPALERIFALIGVDVRQWYSKDLRRERRPALDRRTRGGGSGAAAAAGPTLHAHFQSEACVLCDAPCAARQVVCNACAAAGAAAHNALRLRQRTLEERRLRLLRHCAQCAAASPASELHVGAECAALDCEVLYARLKTARHAAVAEEHVRWLEEGY